ncbi:hypothetical protein BDN72DRAFT_830175 [Pluteus cervinus]|uniref:Uncharacterized protein n=1 Tax=Pluteus cervinus TaxID=181527 RepID=A0ACD3BG45_9AGAR|nr:hypothetical protein BDN72DRAFT_830175 [Pluteus cervinus]
MSRLHALKEGRFARPSRHLSVASQDTTASGIADSTISFGDSIRLSQFPDPPSSIPSTPVSFGGFRVSPTPSNQSTPRVPHRRPDEQCQDTSSGFSASTSRPVPAAARSSSRSPTSAPTPVERRAPLLPPSPSRSLSPHDWHEGASSIDVDTAEDRLLSTSFITSLLRENQRLVEGARRSATSEAYSRTSEMTYPPSGGFYSNTPPRGIPSSYHPPAGPRAPPSSYVPVREESIMTDDSSTIISSREMTQPTIIRTASVSQGLRLTGASVVGLVPATLHATGFRGSHASSNPRHTHNVLPEADEEYNFDYRNALPPTANPQTHQNNSRTHRPRESVHSVRSGVSSFLSRMSSRRSVRRVLAWAKKPLPPVPRIANVPISEEMRHRKLDDDTPLPELMHRADTLHGMLEKGYQPHQSLNTYYSNLKAERYLGEYNDLSGGESTPYRYSAHPQQLQPNHLQSLSSQSKVVTPKRRRIIVLLSIFVVLAVACVGAVIAVVLRKKSSSVSCPDGLAGVTCSLDASCVCSSTIPGRCDSLAKSIMDLVPTVNQLFVTNFTNNDVYSAIWLASSSSTGPDCASQAVLVDVAPSLDSNTFPNRTTWAQAALLWNIAESQDITATRKLQDAVKRAPWHQLGDQDGPNDSGNPAFSATQSGFNFNFAAQTVTPPQISFVTDGQPTNAQIAQVSPTAQQSLDLMYSYALASSTQQTNALVSYWTSVLEQKPADLTVFLSTLSIMPILLPFDATFSRGGQTLASQLTNSTTAPFPPPLACYPGLLANETARINQVEDSVFGLNPSPSQSTFDPACYPDRPLYGVLDLLHLRLPYARETVGTPQQAVVLNRDVAPRAIIRVGEFLSTLPVGSTNATEPINLLNPRQYGTLNHCNHVILQYLQAIPDVATAKALVQFVLATAASTPPPPGENTPLFEALKTIPTLEVAVFGSVNPSNVRSVTAAFGEPSGNLFFGSPEGAALRDWAITAAQSTLVWTDNASSPLIVADDTFTDENFNTVWAAAALAVQQNAVNVGVVNITTSFQNLGKFTSD